MSKDKFYREPVSSFGEAMWRNHWDSQAKLAKEWAEYGRRERARKAASKEAGKKSKKTRGPK